MRKHILAVFLSFFLCLFISSTALANTNWQIEWQESGILKEQVSVSGQELNNAGPDWQTSNSGNEIIFSRSVQSWEDYNNLTDKFPVQATVKNLLCCRIITITALTNIANNTLYSSLDTSQPLRLEMNVPGIILDSTSDGADKNMVYWEFENYGEGFDQDFIFRAIMVDGFGLGITILGVGAIVLAIFFILRMRKVNRIIDETYSLNNIVIEDEEDD